MEDWVIEYCYHWSIHPSIIEANHSERPLLKWPNVMSFRKKAADAITSIYWATYNRLPYNNTVSRNNGFLYFFVDLVYLGLCQSSLQMPVHYAIAQAMFFRLWMHKFVFQFNLKKETLLLYAVLIIWYKHTGRTSVWLKIMLKFHTFSKEIVNLIMKS